MVKEVSTRIVKLGFKGYAGNKGAVGIRFGLMDSSLCFVNCHLVPHKKAYKDRNKNII